VRIVFEFEFCYQIFFRHQRALSSGWGRDRDEYHEFNTQERPMAANKAIAPMGRSYAPSDPVGRACCSTVSVGDSSDS
jgi:hypothetical protein